ncbi:COX15/CtaA family protein [Vibrio methylphosphonaticus]|uniref:COX15/CtaA family protein n=1 Tax=Vibrio methylphosphonaticus TaxID=2946866 RepID=UPI002029EA8C|nr:COX15/CtaA family protein [Vibrio methylphosphonaticus]MCL9773687.1 COX15/CtaA family protein [Vibrio methylphosphonaticus]
MKLIHLIRLSLVLTVIVIAMGAYTRLADAGLGCPDWPGCYGQLMVPTDKVAVQVANTLYPERAVEQDKAWLEMIHRYLAGGLGLLVFMITVVGIAKERHKLGWLLPLSLSVVIVFQAALGMWTVTLKLMPIVVMGHLLGGFTMFSLLFFSYLRLRPSVEVDRQIGNSDVSVSPPRRPFLPKVIPPSHVPEPTSLSRQASAPELPKTLKYLAAAALVVTIIQIMLGGWTSSNYAAVVCTSLPICEGRWFESLDFITAFTPAHLGVESYEFGILDYAARMTIHVTHRIGAMLVTVVVGVLILQLIRQPHNAFKRLGRALATMLVVQLLLGVSNVVFHLPLGVAVLHNLGAALLLLTLIHTNYVIRTVRVTTHSKPTFSVIESYDEIPHAQASGDKESSL